MHPRLKSRLTLQAEIARFEELVIKGGPVVLPGTLDILHRVRALPPPLPPTCPLTPRRSALARQRPRPAGPSSPPVRAPGRQRTVT